MRVIALDTTTNPGSAALVEDDRVLDERMGDASRSQAERLPRELETILDASGLRWLDVDLFAVAAGPGSFTGLRIGIATIQGLSFVTRRRVAAISALEALAQVGSEGMMPGSIVAAVMNAYRKDVFAARYEVTAAALFDAARLTTIDEPMVGSPDAILSRWAEQGTRSPHVVIGDGAALYADLIAGHLPAASVRAAPRLAGTLGRMAVMRARRSDTVDPAGIQPLYVRRPDVELTREKRASPLL